jgi:hypothetical protein
MIDITRKVSSGFGRNANCGKLIEQGQVKR